VTTFIFRKHLYEFFIEFDDWFQNHEYQGLVGLYFLYFLFVPLNLPHGILSLFGGYMLSKKYGPVMGFSICILEVFLGYHSAAVLTFIFARNFLK